MRTSVFIVSVLVSALALGGGRAQDAAKKAEPVKWPEEVGGKPLKEWVNEIKDADPSVSENAIRTLAFFGPEASRLAGPALIDRLGHRDSSLRANAAAALGYVNTNLTGDTAQKAVNELARVMTEDPQTFVRFQCAMALTHFGAEAKPVIPKLVRASHDGSTWEVRRAAILGLTAAGPPRPNDAEKGPDIAAVKGLMDKLTDVCALVRQEAASGIGLCGRPSQEADRRAVLSALQLKFGDAHKLVGLFARTSYMTLDEPNEQHLSAIAKLLKSSDLPVRCQAARAVAHFAPQVPSKGKVYIAEVIEMLHDKEPDAVIAAATSMVEVGEGLGRPAIPVMEDLVRQRDINPGVKAVLEASLKELQRPGKRADRDDKKPAGNAPR